MTIQLKDTIFISGVHQAAGTSLTLDAAAEAELVNRKVAVYTARTLTPGENETPITATRDASGNVTGLSVGEAMVSIPYSAVRKEQRLSTSYPKTFIAKIKNPSATIDYTSTPVAIAVSFGEGELHSADQIEVINASGTTVEWQWEGAKHPATGASIELHNDGSIRAGYIWVNESLTGGQTKTYSIKAHGYELGQFYDANVVYTAVSGTIDELATSAMRARFESNQAWMLRRYQDIGASSFDLFAGTNGLGARHKISSATTVSSATGAHVTQISHGRVGADAFGYGVVFQEYETVISWVSEPTTTVTAKYRMFADGSIRFTHVTNFGEAIASDNKGVWSIINAGTTSLTETAVDASKYNRYDYPTTNFIFAMRHIVKDSTGAYTILPIRDVTGQGYIGWTATLGMPAGAQYINDGVVTKYTAGDSAAAFIRLHNPVYSQATIPKPKLDKLLLAELYSQLASEAINSIADDQEWLGARALIQLSLGDSNEYVLSEFESYCSNVGITPESSASWLSQWNSERGYEYIGRNVQVLPWLYSKFTAAGDTTNADLVKTYIDAYADFCVSAYVASGSTGKVKLKSGAAGITWNATTSCIAGLAASLGIGADATRQAAMDACLAAYTAAVFAGQKWAYADVLIPPVNPLLHYYAFQTFELARAYRLKSMTLPTGSLCSYMREYLLAEGFVNDVLADELYRRGRESTSYYIAASLIMLEQDYAGAYEAIRHVAALDKRYSAYGIDGFSGVTGSTDIAMDIRALAECKLLGLMS